MKIKLLVSRVNADGAQNRGDEIDVTEAEALRMEAAGQCLILPTVEKATAKRGKVEKAI